jgi:hypothetical protein
LIALFSAILAVATLVPGQMAPSPQVGAAARGAAAGVHVNVQRVSAAGALSSAAGVEVLLERWTTAPSRMGESALDAIYQATTGPDGRAVFPAAARAGGATVVASVVDRGITRRASPDTRTPNRPIALRLYDDEGTPSELEGVMQIDLSIRDGFVIVETAWTVSTTGRRLVRFEGDGRMPVPMALPAVFGGSLDAAMLPPDTARRHLALSVSPETGRLVLRDGGIFFEGHIAPGQGTLIRVRYALPIVAERMDLAVRSPIALAGFSLSSSWSDRVAPRVVPDRAFRAHRRVRGETVQRLLRVLEPPAAGEPMVLFVSRLPRPLDVHAATAVGGSLILLFLFGLAVASGWRRER